MIVYIDQPVIAHGHFVSIPAKIFHHLFGTPERLLGVNHPIGSLKLPDELLILWQLFLQPGNEFGPEHG